MQHPQLSLDEVHEEISTRSPISDAAARVIAAGLRRENLGGAHLAAIAAGERAALHDALAELDALPTAAATPACRLALAALRRWVICDGTRFDPALSDQQILDHYAWLEEFTRGLDSSPPEDWPT